MKPTLRRSGRDVHGPSGPSEDLSAHPFQPYYAHRMVSQAPALRRKAAARVQYHLAFSDGKNRTYGMFSRFSQVRVLSILNCVVRHFAGRWSVRVTGLILPGGPGCGSAMIRG